MSYWHDAHYSPILMCNSKSKDTPLPEHPTVIKIRKLTLLHYFWLVSNLIYVLAVVSTICFAAKRSSQWSRVAFGFFLISLSLQSHSPLTFMTFIGHSLGRTPLSLGMSVWGFLTIDLDDVYVAGVSQKHKCDGVFFLLHLSLLYDFNLLHYWWWSLWILDYGGICQVSLL